MHLILFGASPIPAAGAVLSTVSTLVEVRGTGTVGFQETYTDQLLVSGDDVRTSSSGLAVITYSDRGSTVLEPGAEVKVLPPVRRNGLVVNRLRQSFGNSWSQFSDIAAGGVGHQIETPAGVLAVRDGASVRVGVGRSSGDNGLTQVVVLDGSATLSAEGDSVTIEAGQMVTAEEGKPLPAPEEAIFTNEIIATLTSSFTLLVLEPTTSLATGLLPGGAVLTGIPLSITTGAGSQPQEVNLMSPEARTFVLQLLPRPEETAFELSVVGYSGVDSVPDGYLARGQLGACQWVHFVLNVRYDTAGDIARVELSGPYPTSTMPNILGLTDLEDSCPPPTGHTEVLGAQGTPEPNPRPIIVLEPVEQSAAGDTLLTFAATLVLLGPAALLKLCGLMRRKGRAACLIETQEVHR